MGIIPDKNKLHIILNLCDVLSAKKEITGVLLEEDALAFLLCMHAAFQLNSAYYQTLRYTYQEKHNFIFMV